MAIRHHVVGAGFKPAYPLPGIHRGEDVPHHPNESQFRHRPLDKPVIMELMFPTAQTALAPTAAVPSLADIVREKTQGGRLIVRFFLSTMEGEFEDARIHHRVDAAKQLVILQHNSSFSDVVRDETDNGDRIINFLFSVMMGEIEGARQHHRNEAGKQLARLDPLMARALADHQTRTPDRAVGIATDAPLHTGAVGDAGGLARGHHRTGDQRRQRPRPVPTRRDGRQPHRIHHRKQSRRRQGAHPPVRRPHTLRARAAACRAPARFRPRHGARGHALEDAAEAGVEVLRVSRRPDLRLRQATAKRTTDATATATKPS